MLVYKDLIISTIVDCNNICSLAISVYKDLIISTIVDINFQAEFEVLSIKT